MISQEFFLLINPDDTDDDGDDNQRKKRVCIERYSDDIVQKYSDLEFMRHFRLDRDTTNLLIMEYSDSDLYVSRKKLFLNFFFLFLEFKVLVSIGYKEIPPHKQLYCFLGFVGHQVATYRDVADRFVVSLSALYFIISKVSAFINSLEPRYVYWPSDEEMQATKKYYEDNFNIPDVIGSIDGTHFKIGRPADHQECYYNRHDYFFIQGQVICDHQ